MKHETIKLHKPSVKLAGLYLAILMVISLFFSANIYHLSLQELSQNVERQDALLHDIYDPRQLSPSVMNRLDTGLRKQYRLARRRVTNRLLVTNVIILGVGGVLSYYLARRTLQPIEDAHDALERFTADASHELRTPIAAMQSEIEVSLMNPNLTLAQATTQLQSNLEELAKLTALSEGLLRLAHAEQADLPFQALPLQEVVTKAVAHVKSQAGKKHITLDITVDPKLIIAGDRDSLVEALVIILDNAIKYSPEKSQVTILAKSGHGHHTLSVTDQGIGIQASELPHIFDRFYRADTARSKQHTTGYGLGLAIAKNIIDLHSGSISAKSTVGKGTTFTVQLPVASANRQAAA